MGQLVYVPLSSGSVAPPVVTTPIHLYLSGANGNDANDGLTPATAKATVAGVWAVFPEGLAAPLIIHCGAAGVVGDNTAYDWTSMPTPTQLTESARIWIYGDGAGQAGEDGFEEIVADVAAAGTTAQQITIAAPVAVNLYQHMTIEILDGPAAGYRRTVMENTATQIYGCRQFDDIAGATTVTPVAGNAFRIVRPSVIFDGIDAITGEPGFLGNIGGGDGAAPLFAVNVAFAAITGAVEINNCAIYMAGVEFRGTRFPSFVNCTGSIGWWDNLASGSYATPGIDTSVSLALQLPRSADILDAKGEWFADIGLVASTARLAEWRGWGVSCSGITATDATNVEKMSFYGCQLGVTGTFSHVEATGCPQLGIGGYLWSGLRVQANSFVVTLPQNIATTKGTVFRSQIDVDGMGSKFMAAGPVESTIAGKKSIYVIRGASAFFSGSLTVVVTAGGGGTVIDVLSNSQFSAWDGITVDCGNFANVSGLRASNTSAFHSMWTVAISNCVATGLTLLAQSSYTSYGPGGVFTFTGTGAPLSVFEQSQALMPITVNSGSNITVENSKLHLPGTLTAILSGSMILRGGSQCLALAAVSVTSTATAALSLTDSEMLLNAGAATFIGVGGVAATLTNSRLHRNSSGTFTTTGGVTLTKNAEVIFDSVTTIGGALSLATGSSGQNSAALSCTTALTLSASCWTQSANLTVTGAADTAAALVQDSAFRQLAGALSCVATAGDGMSLASESRASLLSAGSVVLTGAGGGAVGLRAVGGSKAWFAGAPTSVTGPAGADLVVGGNAAVANGTLAAANNFITDTDTTGLLGGGNVIGRAA